MKLKSSTMAVLGIILIGSLCRMMLAGTIGLGVDESYAVSVARQLSLSYFDHPPLHFWIIWLTAQLSGTETPLMLRLPFIGMFAGTTWLMYRIGTRLFDEWSGVYAALILNISAVFSLSTGSWILPDGPLVFFMLSATLLLIRLTFEPAAAWYLWPAAGLLIGLGMLAKYHAIFLLVGSCIFYLTTKERAHVLRTAGPYLTLTAAALVFLPVILWNQEHHWTSFLFQGGRGTVKEFAPLNLLKNLAGQTAWLLPWMALPLQWILLKAVFSGPGHPRQSPNQDKLWFLCCLAIGPIALFTLIALWGGQGLFHWQAPGYLLAIPLLGRAAAGWIKQGSKLPQVWLGSSTILFLLLIALLGTHTATGWLRHVQPDWFKQGDPTIEALNWDSLPPYLEANALPNPETHFIVTAHWIDAGKTGYILGRQLPVVCLNSEPHHFAFMHKTTEFTGKNALIIGRKAIIEKALPQYRSHFSSVQFLGTTPVVRTGIPELELVVFYATNFGGRFSLPYGQ